MPLKSMTAFASTDGQEGNLGWRWELRSVNSKGLDIRLRLPAGFEALEAPARSAVQARLGRGSVNAQLSFSRQASAGQSSINLEAMESLVEALLLVRQGCEARGIPVAPVTGEALALSPALQQSVRDDLPELVAAAMPAMTEGLGQALDALVEARQAEGRHIHSTISGQVDRIESLIRDASSAATDSVRVLRERLSRQVAALIADQGGLSDGRLEQEVALLATKADVQEELDRLLAHCAAARDLLSLAEPMGRRLEFLTQELNREANTLCSKAATDAMTRIGLDLKTVIDQLREQAANVE